MVHSLSNNGEMPMNIETRLPFALGDDDRDAERSAMRLEHEAYRKIEEAQRILKDAAILSELKRKELLDYANALSDVVHDYGLSSQDWKSEIMARTE